jgi:uncharacterized protein (TIGR02271 family)
VQDGKKDFEVARRKKLTTFNRSFVIAAFQDNDQAQQAIQDLMNSGFSRDQIRYSVRQGGGGITDDLVSMGIPQQEANYYNDQFQQGSTIVTVNTRDQQQQAYDILMRDGGTDFNTSQGQASNYGAYSTGTAATDATAATAATAANTVNTTATTGDQTQNIELRAEQLQPQTRWQQAGEVQLRKNVVAEQQTIDVPVTREEVYIQRQAVSGQPSDTPITDDGETIRVPVGEEQVDVNKQTVVTGEVTVGKRQVQETQQYTDTVRHEELDVDNQGNVNVQGNQGVVDTVDTTTDQNA